MTPDSTPPASLSDSSGAAVPRAKTPKERERERLAAALRENLKRRKAQARDRRQGGVRPEADESA